MIAVEPRGLGAYPWPSPPHPSSFPKNLGLETVPGPTSQYGGRKKLLESSSTQRVVAPLSSKLTKIVIANRGEIAVRIAFTLKKLGIHSVAVYSRQDRGNRQVAVADSSFLVEGDTVAETYLDGKQIIKIAKTSGADAIIPGYGFLSENSDFAEECEKEGTIWIGPTPHQMRTLGLKHLARELAQQSEIPLLPGSALVETVKPALTEADKIGYPLMMKSTAGGGGIGLQKFSAPDIQTAFTTVSHQGKTYFNESGTFLEHFVENARHIEVQIIGNGQGDVKHLGLRDCSLKRRNQKVIEESPATCIPAEASRQMCEAALRLAKTLSYRNVGTVDFIYDLATSLFYFLEVNTRLQVEHSVTEAVLRIDLVEAMIRVASNDSSSLFDSFSEIVDVSPWAAAKGKERMWMFEVFDRIRFYPVSEETLDEARESETTGNLVKIEDGQLNLADYEVWIKEISEEAAETRRLRLQTLKETGLVDELKQAYQSDSSRGGEEDEDEVLNDKGMIVRADIAGRCWQCTIKEGYMVEVGQELLSHYSLHPDHA